MEQSDLIALYVFMWVMIVLGVAVVVATIGYVLYMFFGWFEKFYGDTEYIADDEDLADTFVSSYTSSSTHSNDSITDTSSSKVDTSVWDNNNINLMQNNW